MDLYKAIKERRSCRNFLPDPIDDAVIEKILDAAIWAPSPLNMQPWEFLVVTNAQLKKRIFEEADRCRVWALETTGWKWLSGYDMSFLESAPVMVAVVGDPKKSGVDMFQEEGGVGYQHACAAAVQNLLLAAHAEGLGGLWFTFYDKKKLRGILDIDPEKTPVALVCLGRPGAEPVDMPRKAVEKKVSYLR
jgi:nitroreductase